MNKLKAFFDALDASNTDSNNNNNNNNTNNQSKAAKLEKSASKEEEKEPPKNWETIHYLPLQIHINNHCILPLNPLRKQTISNQFYFW